MPREVVLLVNPVAGRGRGARAAAIAAETLRSAGLSVQEVAGRDAVEAAGLAVRAVDSGPDAVVAVGGDGMVHLALQAVAGRDVPFGVVPAGTGNDFARALGVPLRRPAAAAAIVAQGLREGTARAVDLGRSEGTWFGCVAAAGFDARVNDRANRMTWPRGRARYPLAMLAELGVFRPVPYVIETDGSRWETAAMLVVVGNARSYGGGMLVTPGARMDDGLLDVLVLSELATLQFLRVFPRVYRGTHVSHPAVTVLQTRRVHLQAPGITTYVDGEVLGTLPRTFEAVPGAVQVLAAQSS
ncbi:MAG TPA: diacylglycerol kinase [Jiangellales bacterium]|nr:diacylglycerol kinase [Jiangellales bacterium]